MPSNRKEYQESYLQHRKTMDPEHECENCGATRGHYVVRDKLDGTYWSGDHDLHFKAPWKWKKPARVDIVIATGLCRTCQAIRNKELAGIL